MINEDDGRIFSMEPYKGEMTPELLEKKKKAKEEAEKMKEELFTKYNIKKSSEK